MSKFVSVNDTREFRIQKRAVHKLVKFLSDELNFKIFSLNISFVSSDKMIEINNAFLGHDYDTDIVTLDYSEGEGGAKKLDAEIYISYNQAKRNAKKYKVSVNEEVIRLIIHGILHLTGYDDTTPNEKRKMKRAENKLTKKYSFMELLK